MKLDRWVGVILLLFLGFVPARLSAQEAGAGGRAGDQDAVRLEQNYPNPFNPSTRIPFHLGGELFESERPVRVTIRIFNVLQQLVAVPTALNHPNGSGAPVENLVYTTPGRKEAFWDGQDRFGQEVASGVYYMQLVVNGTSRVQKMVVAK